jgi:hypothetical protein
VTWHGPSGLLSLASTTASQEATWKTELGALASKGRPHTPSRLGIQGPSRIQVALKAAPLRALRRAPSLKFDVASQQTRREG